ncbi:hypothetical protein A4A49_61368, partial [Nicotiana attenuata]
FLEPKFNDKGLSITEQTNIGKYQSAVLELLRKSKVDRYDSYKLYKLQRMIEEQAYPYDDIQSLFEATPMMVNLLVKKDAPSAKEYLKASKKLTTGELDLLNLFHQYTLEGIIIYIFGCLFNSINESPAVRLSTLVDQLDKMARVHAKLLSKRNYQRVRSKPSVNVIPGCITKNMGVLLVEFLLERELITTSNDLSFPDQRVNKTVKGGKTEK